VAGITGRVAAGMVTRIVCAGVTVCCNRRETDCVMARIAFQCGCKMVRRLVSGVATVAIAGNSGMVEGCRCPCNGGVAVVTGVALYMWCGGPDTEMAGGACRCEYTVINICRFPACSAVAVTAGVEGCVNR
jgi:hypothetical protein